MLGNHTPNPPHSQAHRKQHINKTLAKNPPRPDLGVPKEDRAARFSDEKVEVDKRGNRTPKRERTVRKTVYGRDYLAWKLTVSLEGDKHSVFTLVCDKDVSIAFVLSEAIREFGDHGDPLPIDHCHLSRRNSTATSHLERGLDFLHRK